MITPVRRTTPRNSLEIIYDLIPLDLFGEYEAIATLTRLEDALKQDWIGVNPKCITYIGHRKYWYDCRLNTMGHVIYTDRVKEIVTTREYKINTESMEKKPQKPIPSQISIYTDGSQTPQHVGSGLVIYELNKEICYKSLRLSDNTTVFQAEMIAIRDATQLMIEHLQEHQKYIKIFSDSQAAIQALNSPTITSKIVEETVRNLNTLGSKVNRLEIEWIKAHVGYEGNERADELARLLCGAAVVPWV